jgi:hypothetical protein
MVRSSDATKETGTEQQLASPIASRLDILGLLGPYIVLTLT